jgi:hypothetical protein
MRTTTDILTAARAEALFASYLPADVELTLAKVTDAIRGAVRAYGGTCGCAVVVAGEYGDHPETAVPRMRWALQVVAATYARRRRTAASPLLRLDSRRLRVGETARGLRAAA